MKRVVARGLGFAAVHQAPSALGNVAAAVAAGEVRAVAFGHRTASAARAALARIAEAPCDGEADDCDWSLAEAVVNRLVRYAAGEAEDFRDVPVALTHLTPFGRRVIRACREIPRGRTRTYGELASLAGAPGAARAVGQVMAGNRAPLIVPCHRVIASGGGLGGFSAPEGLIMKRRLLDLEAGGGLESVGAAVATSTNGKIARRRRPPAARGFAISGVHA